MRRMKEAKTIVDDRGVMIVSLEPIGHQGDTQYFGVAKVMLPVGSEDIRFPIPAGSVDEAFDMYDAELQRFSDDFQKQVAANSKIEEPSSMQDSNSSQA